MRLRYSDEATPVCLYAILQGVYDVGSRADITAEWALSCKECRDDSSRACEAGDVGRGSILTMTDTASLLLRWSRRTVSALHMTSSLFTM